MNSGRSEVSASSVVALTIAGSDSGGGAGIQADLKTFRTYGVFGTSAITAVTAQDTTGVRAIQKITPEMVRAQIEAVAGDLAPRAAKTGMLASAEIISAVAATLREARIPYLVVDPVMVAESGDPLLEEEAVETLREELLPLATLVTPNLHEAQILSGRSVTREEEMREAAEVIARSGPAVLLKGGHLASEELVDLLRDGGRWHEWRSPRLETRDTHGTGCTLSSAITAGLALGWSRLEAVESGLRFVRRAIESAPGLGAGNGPVNHGAPVPRPGESG